MVGKKIVLIGPVYPYKGGISHYTGLMYRELICRRTGRYNVFVCNAVTEVPTQKEE